MKLQVPLVSGAVTLRPLDVSDATGPYLQWMQDPLVERYLESRFAKHTAQTLIEFINVANEAPNVFLAGIFFEGRHVGNIKLAVNENHQRGEFGILIGERDVWGQGVARRAIGLLSDYAFGTLHLKKLSAGCYGPNLGSIKAFEAAGFHVEATRPRHYLCDGEAVDGIYLARFAPERTN